MWKTWPGHRVYEVSTDGGLVRNSNGKILSPYFNHKGYARVTLCMNGKQFNKMVSRLVAETFLDDWDPELKVDHIDHNPRNNDLPNLRMVTVGQNNNNRRAGRPRVDRTAVDQYTEDGVFLGTFASAAEAASKVAPGKPHARINIHNAIRNGRLACGFVWKDHEKPTDADLPGEIWKRYGSDAYGSNLGRYKRFCGKRFTHTLIGADLTLDSCGYPFVCVSGKNIPLHHLVAELFLPPPEDPKLVVNHKNGVKTDATAENLEWITQSKNGFHAHENQHINTRKPVAQVCNTTGEVIATFNSAAQAQRETGVMNIGVCARGRCQSVGGFRWQFV